MIPNRRSWSSSLAWDKYLENGYSRRHWKRALLFRERTFEERSRYTRVDYRDGGTVKKQSSRSGRQTGLVGTKELLAESRNQLPGQDPVLGMECESPTWTVVLKQV